jgi:hypothetical protein
MTNPTAPPIESLGIDTIDLTYTARERRYQCLDQQTVVIVHQAVRLHAPLKALADPKQPRTERPPILGIPKDRGTRVTSRQSRGTARRQIRYEAVGT